MNPYLQILLQMPLRKLLLVVISGGVFLWILLMVMDSPKVQAESAADGEKGYPVTAAFGSLNRWDKPSFLPPPPGPFYRSQYASLLSSMAMTPTMPPPVSERRVVVPPPSEEPALYESSSFQVPSYHQPFRGNYANQGAPRYTPPNGYGYQGYENPYAKPWPQASTPVQHPSSNRGMNYPLVTPAYQMPAADWGSANRPGRYSNYYPAPTHFGHGEMPRQSPRESLVWPASEPWALTKKAEGPGQVWYPGISGYEHQNVQGSGFKEGIGLPENQRRYFEP